MLAYQGCPGKKPLNGCSSRVVVLITVGRPFVKRFALCYHTVVCLLSVCPVCNVRAVRPNSWTDQDATWYRGRPWPRRHCVRWGHSSPPKKGAEPPRQFLACLSWPNGWMALGLEVSLGPGHTVLDGDPAPLPKKGAEPPPNFWPIFIVAKWLDASKCHLVRR